MAAVTSLIILRLASSPIPVGASMKNCGMSDLLARAPATPGTELECTTWLEMSTRKLDCGIDW